MDAPTTVKLPPALRSYVAYRISEGDYTDAQQYIEALIEQEQRAWNQKRIEAALIEGMEGGPGTPVTPEFFDDLRRRLTAKHAGRKS